MSHGSSDAVARLDSLLNEQPARAQRGAVRGLVRRLLLRAMRPHTAHEHEVDAAILSVLSTLTREAERADVSGQPEREDRTRALLDDLVLACEALRRRIEQTEHRLRTDLLRQMHPLPFVAGSPFETFGSLVGEVSGYRALPVIGAESPYVGFEDLFRGSADRVTNLQRPYLPLVRAHQPVLDIGCGRGEFLALLANEGIDAQGIDSDAGMVERCRKAGLPVIRADALEYLTTIEDASLGAIFSTQVIEHLPVAKLQQLISLAAKKLAPGGLLIAETVNPHNPAALHTFWVDLTHQHPIFPEVALALCALAGFVPAYVFAPGFDSYQAARFEASSYAVVATAPTRDSE